MLPHQFYNVVHILGIAMLFTALGGTAMHALNGGTKATNAGRKLVGILHGLALFLILLGGFGMMARLGIAQAGWPGWIYAKLAIWVALPLVGVWSARRPERARLGLVLMPLLGGVAAVMAIYKPI